MTAVGTSPQVVCVGVVSLDSLALVDVYPDADQRVLASAVEVAGGGPAATAAVTLTRQGVSAAFVGRVGDDADGRAVLAQLEREGVDISGVQVSTRTATQRSLVVVARERRSRAIAALDVPPLTELSPVATALIAEAQWVHADHLGFTASVHALARLRPRPRLSVDAGNLGPEAQLHGVDLYGPTATALCARYGLARHELDQAAARALVSGARVVVATAGANGARAWWSERGAELVEAPGAGVISAGASRGVGIQSTVGAGDVFHGALLAALCRGSSWREALAAASASAALSCRALDGRSAIPDLAELEVFMHAERESRQRTLEVVR
jgi:sugar/nucleoside kinase (ribokinase family)